MAMASKEEDGHENGATCKREGRQCGDRKAKLCRTLNISFLYKVIPLGDLVLCMENLHAKGLPTIGNALVLFRVRSTAQSGHVESGGVAFHT